MCLISIGYFYTCPMCPEDAGQEWWTLHTGLLWSDLQEHHYQTGQGPVPECFCIEEKLAEWKPKGYSWERLCCRHELEHHQNANVIRHWGGQLPWVVPIVPVDEGPNLAWFASQEVYENVWKSHYVVGGRLHGQFVEDVGDLRYVTTLTTVLIDRYNLPARSVDLEEEDNRQQVATWLRGVDMEEIQIRELLNWIMDGDYEPERDSEGNPYFGPQNRPHPVPPTVPAEDAWRQLPPSE